MQTTQPTSLEEYTKKMEEDIISCFSHWLVFSDFVDEADHVLDYPLHPLTVKAC